MFSEMIHALQEGSKPALDDLRCRLDAAVVKKGGILQQPKACWSGDTKINPDAAHMFWAAVILGDKGTVATVVGMIEMELSFSSGKIDYKSFLQEKLSELAFLTSDQETSRWLRKKISSASEELKLGN